MILIIMKIEINATSQGRITKTEHIVLKKIKEHRIEMSKPWASDKSLIHACTARAAYRLVSYLLAV